MIYRSSTSFDMYGFGTTMPIHDCDNHVVNIQRICEARQKNQILGTLGDF